MAKERKTSGRKKILEVLGKYPDGLNAAKIRELVLKEYPINGGHVASLLVHLTRENKIVNEGKCGCNVCALRSVIYKVKPPVSPRRKEKEDA